MKFLRDLMERVLGAFATGTLSVFLGGNAVFNVFNADWRMALGVGLGSAVLALLLGVSAKFKGNSNTASLITHKD